ncbi:MAG: glycosyltransferase family 2 protein [Chloroflexota bacterium]
MSGRVWAALFISGMVLASANWRRWPRLPPARERPAGGLPISIVIPARNEKSNLHRLLPSLLCLDPAPLEILVVDDGSADGTAEIARRFGVRVLSAGPRPDGWSGKSWACAVGRAEAAGDWLLFTDSDTWHSPDSLGRAMDAARANAVDVLSLFPRQVYSGFLDGLVLPVAFAGFAAATPPELVNGERGSYAVANGQYVLIRASAYDSVGGHGSVRAAMAEDTGLARIARAGGLRTLMLRGEDAVETRMYSTALALREGLVRTASEYLTEHPARGLAMAVITAAGMLAMPRLRGSAGPRLVQYLCCLAGAAVWTRTFGAPLIAAVLHPLGAALVCGCASESVARWVLRLPLTWRGRSYRVGPLRPPGSLPGLG